MASVLENCPSYLNPRDADRTATSSTAPPLNEIKRMLFVNNTLAEEDHVRVHLRLKPLLEDERKFSDKNEHGIYSVVDPQTLKVDPPEDSRQQARNRAPLRKVHTFKFSSIYNIHSNHEDIFQESVSPVVEHTLSGDSGLVFTYGASNAGKSFTMYGTPTDPGVVPRALDAIFNSLDNLICAPGPFKPFGTSCVVYLPDDERTRELGKLQSILKRWHNASQITNSTASSKLSAISAVSEESLHNSEWNRMEALLTRVRDKTRYSMEADEQCSYSVWISFAEMYNDFIYDLLDYVPGSQNAKRKPLRLAEYKNGMFIKGLTEVCVTSADEAYKVLMAGKYNLHKAATLLNQDSSRSHSIFTIKVVKFVLVFAGGQTRKATVSTLSFCDLAGCERASKTGNAGDRLKESGTINTSLMVLGRVLTMLRDMQHQEGRTKPSRDVIPFRESKLTLLFQNFLLGAAKTSMIVNVSQSRDMVHENLHVLKFSAIASQVQVKAVLKERRSCSRFSLMFVAPVNRKQPGLRETAVPEETEQVEQHRQEVQRLVDHITALQEELKHTKETEEERWQQYEATIRTEIVDQFQKIIEDKHEEHQDELDRIEERNECQMRQREEELRMFYENLRNDPRASCRFSVMSVDGQCADEKLQDELRRTKEELEDAKQFLQEGGSEFAEKEKELAELYRTLNDKNQQILELEEELVTKSSNLDAALSEIKEHVAQREELENLVEELNKKVKEVQDLRANEQLDYTRSHEELQSEKRRLLCEKDNLKAELENLQAKLNEAYSDTENLEKIYRSTKSTWETEKLELKAKMDADIQNKDALLSATVKDLEDERLKIVSLNEALQLLAQEKGALCRDLEEERKNNASAVATIQTLTDERNLGLKQNEELKEKLCSAENLVKTLQSKFEDKNVDGTKKNEEIKTLEKEVKNLNKRIVELQTETAEKDAKVQKNTEELNQLRFLAKDYEVLQLKIKAEGHSSEVTKEVKQDYDRLWGAYEEAQQEIEGLKNGLADKQKELQQFQKNRELGFHHSEAKVKQLTEELQREKREVQKLCEMMSSMTPSKKQEVLEMENCRLKEEAVKLKEENDRLKKDCDKKRHNSNDERRTTLHPAFMPEKEFRKPRQRSKPVAEETDSEKKTTRPRTRRPKPVKYLESDSNDENLDTSNHSNAPLTRSALKKGISTVKISLKEADAATNVKDEDESDFITSEEDKSRRNTRRPLFKPQKSEFDDFDSLVAPKASSGRSTRNHKRL